MIEQKPVSTWKPYLKAKGFAEKPWFFLLIALLGLAPFYFYPALHHPFPTGFAGLYTLISNEIARNQFLPPLSIPLYGPGGMPFAYPPLALYLMAFATHVLGIPQLQYLKFAPPFFTLLSIIPAFFVVLKLLNSKIAALIVIWLCSLAPAIIEFDVTSGGVVRGLAQLLTMTALLWMVEAFATSKPKTILVAGIFLGLTILTHLTNAVFLIVTLLAFWITAKSEFRVKVRVSMGIVLVGVILSAPWWLSALIRFGTSIFADALFSHNNLNFLYFLVLPGELLKTGLLDNLLGPYRSMPVLAVFLLSGIVVAIIQRKWLPLVWFIFTTSFTSQADRLVVYIGAILGGAWLSQAVCFLSARIHRLAAAFILALLVVVNAISPIKAISNLQPYISDDTFQLAQWFQANTTPDQKFFTLADVEAPMEWLPYYLNRVPSMGPWGTEWTDSNDVQVSLFNNVIRCYTSQDRIRSAQDMILHNHLTADYLIIYLPEVGQAKAHYLEQNTIGKMVFSNSHYAVLALNHPD